MKQKEFTFSECSLENALMKRGYAGWIFSLRNVFGILSRSIFMSRNRHICYELGCISPICPMVMSVLRWCDDIYHENGSRGSFERGCWQAKHMPLWHLSLSDPGVRNSKRETCILITTVSISGMLVCRSGLLHYVILWGERGSVVVKALCYKPEGRGFDSQWDEILNLPNPSGRTRPWGLLSL
jgi:hypothetical protein